MIEVTDEDAVGGAIQREADCHRRRNFWHWTQCGSAGTGARRSKRSTVLAWVRAQVFAGRDVPVVAIDIASASTLIRGR